MDAVKRHFRNKHRNNSDVHTSIIAVCEKTYIYVYTFIRSPRYHLFSNFGTEGGYVDCPCHQNVLKDDFT